MITSMITELQTSFCIYLVFILIIGDTILGFLRSCKEKAINSSVGINGLLRKAAIVVSIAITFFADLIFNFNLVGFLPEDILNFIKIREIGLLEIFSLLFILFESLSILKNLQKMGLPVPKKIENLLEKLLSEITDEQNTK